MIDTKSIKKDVDDAIALLSQLSVSGDVIDLMAAVRSKMFRASKALDDTMEDDDG